MPDSPASGVAAACRLFDPYIERLIAKVKPAPASEARRQGVASYVRSLIARCFHPEKVSRRLLPAVGFPPACCGEDLRWMSSNASRFADCKLRKKCAC